MGRAERPVTPHTKDLEELALWLRSQRQRAGLTYAKLSAETGMTVSRLSRAANGDAVPSLEVVEAYAKGCGAALKDLRMARRLWRRARLSALPSSPAEQHFVHISMVGSWAELWAAMVHLRRRSGQPSLRELQSRGGKHGELARSTLSLVLRGQARPSLEFLHRFVRACGVTSVAVIEEWQQAWARAHNRSRETDLLQHYEQLFALSLGPSTVRHLRERLTHVEAPSESSP
ncbi:helix-turn-helix domain-containing protein [Kitasatospora sp. NPDC058218]|uniref:helix-turn-helix domain-containing protein n=1 Tax=Kitasatospora sp. NPDC058218 TaxID=3346385 RepID=UPI0036DCCE5F